MPITPHLATTDTDTDASTRYRYKYLLSPARSKKGNQFLHPSMEKGESRVESPSPLAFGAKDRVVSDRQPGSCWPAKGAMVGVGR